MVDSGLESTVLCSCAVDIPVCSNSASEKVGPVLPLTLQNCSVTFARHQFGLLSFLTCIIKVLGEYTNGVGFVL